MKEDKKDKPDLTLFIKGMPLKTKIKFIKFADEDFMGDYGFTIKHLLDLHFGAAKVVGEMIDQKFLEIKNDFEEVTKQIDILKGKVSSGEKKKDERKMMDGTVLKRGK